MIPYIDDDEGFAFFSCPDCHSHMFLRYSYKTKWFFLGCSKFPRCKGISNVSRSHVISMINITLGYMPKLLKLSNSPEFLRGDSEALTAVFDLGNECGEEFMTMTDDFNGTYLTSLKDCMLSHNARV